MMTFSIRFLLVFCLGFLLQGCGLINGVSNGGYDGPPVSEEFFGVDCRGTGCSCVGDGCICDNNSEIGFGPDPEGVVGENLFCACKNEDCETCTTQNDSSDCVEFDFGGGSYYDENEGYEVGCACLNDQCETVFDQNDDFDFCEGPPGSCQGSLCVDPNAPL
ncbi:MAG: hypothetical protein GY822_14010 [Deltaproteobacteria bacterium]|nr:hypothetical protein [Deltaproteobacteria bacterium]